MTIPAMFQKRVSEFPHTPCQLHREGPKKQFTPTTYEELYRIVGNLACALERQGVHEGSRIGLISDNRPEWLALDLALLSLGAADVPRGSDTLSGELLYILDFSECPIAILENVKQLNKILPYEPELPYLGKIILIDGPEELPECSWDIINYKDLLKEGADNCPKDYLPNLIAEERGKDLATLIYTSGTTGEPKGVMLTHANFLYLVEHMHTQADISPGDIWLSVLPVWHSFERIVQYIALNGATTIAYSLPIGKVMLMDFQELNPQWMASVPRIWSAMEAGILRNIKAKGKVAWALFRFFFTIAAAHQAMTNRLLGRVADFRRKFTLPLYIIYPPLWLLLYPLRKLGDKLIFQKIREKTGRRFQAGLSGGGALSPELYRFFQTIGIQLLEGYGLTETAPVAAFSSQHHPVMGVVGKTYPQETQIKVVDEESRECAPGEKGLVLIKGPQVMKGYFQKPEYTNAVLNREGWFNSGDLGMKTIHGELKIVGRAKDTIVLLGGENIEPVPMEMRLAESPYIEQAVVVGQDQKYLAALILPDYDNLESYARENNLGYENRIHLCDVHAILELLDGEINRLISEKNGFRPFERIFRFTLLRRPFEVGKELSAKQEIKRHVINEEYKKEIASLFR
ncbi:MAG: AMP-binding protein [Spirochaetales bacterium]|nr:AMP-binding protein [Spirochaetales bacterium]